MFGPTSWVFLGALVAGFVALLYWLVQTSHLWVRIIARVVALAVGTLFGASLVNESPLRRPGRNPDNNPDSGRTTPIRLAPRPTHRRCPEPRRLRVPLPNPYSCTEVAADEPIDRRRGSLAWVNR